MLVGICFGCGGNVSSDEVSAGLAAYCEEWGSFCHRSCCPGTSEMCRLCKTPVNAI